MRALVTGGSGFLGGAIARRLLAEGWEVTSLARGRSGSSCPDGARSVAGDVADAEAVLDAARGCHIVFHAAAKVGVWGPAREYHQANVVGTRNVIAACRRLSIPRLVFTGSPSVVFDGRDLEGVDESAPYPGRFDSEYSRTKAAAEEMVLAAADSGLATVSLRPHLVWGPGDNQILPRIVGQARAGVLRRIGAGNKRVDTTYIDNAVEAHWLAAGRLAPGSPVSGRAYFISQGDPRPVWDVIDAFLRAAGAGPLTRTIPEPAAFALAWTLEAAHRALGLRREPRLTRFVVGQLTTAHWFDISRARRDLGYAPRVGMDEGLARLEAWFKAAG